MNEHQETKIISSRALKSPFLAGFLSFLFPGTGALYNRQYLKGVLYIIIFAGLVSMQPESQAQPFVGILLAGFYIFQIVESVQTSRAINRLVVTGEMPPEEKIPQTIPTGSVFWGLLLIILGIFLLLANFDLISYGFLFDFWPVLVIAIGAKMLYESTRKKEE
jgi:uncharacterized membrane protein